MIGETISHYTILEKLGEGGMGVVYKAHDSKLDRFVALKFLPPHLSSSTQDNARFIQEAKAAAALNHPNVCSIIDIQEHDGKMFIVMEHVDGQTLTARRNSLTFKQSVDVGVQIAEGLAAAHEKGIVHRDIKPDNIMIRKDGIAQIMDFGLAKLRAGESKVSRLTREGSTVGTIGYMSPEQVQGMDADHRSDIFSLGVLLYELFTGQLPFKDVHETALMYEIVNVDPPPMSSVKSDLDPELDRIVLECLQKDPDERYNSAKDLAKDLKRFKRESSRQRMSRIIPAHAPPAAPRTGTSPVPAPASFSRRELIAWSVVAVLCIAVGILSIRTMSPAPVASGVIHASLVFPESLYVHSFGELTGPPAISPDGRTLAFCGVAPDGATAIYLRSMDNESVRIVHGTEEGAEPFWSPDGKSLGFFVPGKMKKVDLVGGSSVTLANVTNPKGASWNSDGTVIYAPDFQSPLYRVSSDGQGQPERLTVLDSTRHEGSHRWPCVLPDGKHVLYLARVASEGEDAEGDGIFVSALDGSMKKMLVRSSYNAVYAGGYLLFGQSSLLLAQRFDPHALSLEGDPVKLQEGLLTDVSNNIAVFTASQTGPLVYQAGTAISGAHPLIVDRAGKTVQIIGEQVEQGDSRYSPDGRTVAVYLYDVRSRRANIWIYDLRNGSRRRLTTDDGGDNHPVWSRDGARVYYAFRKSQSIYEQSLSGGPGKSVFTSNGIHVNPLDALPDGRGLLAGLYDTRGGKGDILILPMVGNDRAPVPFQATKFNESDARVSRDGKWIAYVSDESGEDEVYVKPSSDPGAVGFKVSRNGGDTPLWGAASSEIMYVDPQRRVVAVAIRFAGERCEILGAKPLFVLPAFAQSLDASPDGNSFVITRTLEVRKLPPLSLLVGWDQALVRH